MDLQEILKRNIAENAISKNIWNIQSTVLQ